MKPLAGLERCAAVRHLLLALAVLGMLAAHALPTHAESWTLNPSERSLRFAYGTGDSESLDVYSFGPRVAFNLPDAVPTIGGHRLRLALELLGSVVEDDGTAGEVAFNPLILDHRCDVGWRLVPFVEGGEGVVFTWIRAATSGAFSSVRRSESPCTCSAPPTHALQPRIYRR